MAFASVTIIPNHTESAYNFPDPSERARTETKETAVAELRALVPEFIQADSGGLQVQNAPQQETSRPVAAPAAR